MIKRRFYKFEHGDRDAPSESSSSSSDSELEAEATEETEEDDDDVVADVKDNKVLCSSSSGYESEDGSAYDVDVDSSGLPTNDDDVGIINDEQNVNERNSSSKSNAEIEDTQCDTVAEKDALLSDAVGYILKCKSVFKCQLCPRIVCLTEDTLKTHLLSKRHARSEKLLKEGRLKLILNSNGEIQDESHLEKHAQTVAPTRSSANSRKNRGRQRQRSRLKKKLEENATLENTRKSTKNPAKKRRRNDN